MAKPKVCILKTDGTNCDSETSRAFKVAGANPIIVHINELRSGKYFLDDFKALAIPGGFSYGDDISSGKVLANELVNYLSNQINEFVKKERPVIGICNGFQVLVRTGLLPNCHIGNQQLTLSNNQNGKFECRWVNLKFDDSVCKFVNKTKSVVPMQVAHAEGRLLGSLQTISELEQNRQVVFRYSLPDNTPTMKYPENPNGSTNSIAGICDKKGLILGMMPHPERSIDSLPPDWAQAEHARIEALKIFENIVSYIKN